MKYEYDLIKSFYGTRFAQRSGVPLMNHIDEGIEILTELDAKEYVKAAFCLHPLLQGDAEYTAYMPIIANDPKVSSSALVLALDYRRAANAYLCKLSTDAWGIPEISEAVGPLLEDLRFMLIADKRQNQKDFLLYHQGTHPRSDQLTKYFENWLEYLK
jgi:hypothetical protein